MAQPSPASREGDWTCDGCHNRNYAFRSFCNRCKQPRLLVDSKTPSDSKWLPRIGDWICAGCSNNNYASREKCNKCGTSKEVAALPAIALPGAAVAAPTFTHCPLTSSGGLGLGTNNGSSISYNSQSNWSFSGTLGSTTANNITLRPGDWFCTCGFHNYSSRSMCKQCQRLMQPASLSSVLQPILSGMSLSTNYLSLLQAASELSGVGMKRPAAEEMGNDLKRLHTAESTVFQNQLMTMGEPANWFLQPPTQPPTLTLVPAIVGKGAKQWRSGDWMCASCNNHNFASRITCNRCGGKKETMSELLSVA